MCLRETSPRLHRPLFGHLSFSYKSADGSCRVHNLFVPASEDRGDRRRGPAALLPSDLAAPIRVPTASRSRTPKSWICPQSITWHDAHRFRVNVWRVARRSARKATRRAKHTTSAVRIMAQGSRESMALGEGPCGQRTEAGWPAEKS